MFLVDTNILVYGANVRTPEHPAAHAHLEAWRAGSEAWMATWSIFYEFLRVTTHHEVFSHPLSLAQAWDFLRALSASPAFRLLRETERHADVVSDLGRRYPGTRGNHVHDFHIAALMMEHGVREIRTADSDFCRFDFLAVVNPIASDPS